MSGIAMSVEDGLRRRAFVTLSAVLAVAAGCTGQPSSTEGAASSGAGGHSVGGGGGQGAGGNGGAFSVPVLGDTGLVVRYYLDEANLGQGPTEAVDAAPEPLNLSLIYGPEMTFGGEDGRRGLHFDDAGLDSRAAVLVDATKVQQLLAGSTQATLEVVVTVEALNTQASRIFHIGADTQSGALTFSASYPYRLNFFWQNDTKLGEFDVPLTSGRLVLHGVLNTTEADEGLRARVYYNGSPAINTVGTVPGTGQQIDIESDQYLVIGNREVGSRSMRGTIHYAALYNVALSEEQLARHAHVLLLDDDTPAPAAGTR